MVSKVAVIALVAIIAVPIMLGYAMNLEQVTETDYKTAGDNVNVTPLLQSGTSYTTVKGDINTLNQNAGIVPSSRTQPPIVYERTTSARSSVFAYQASGVGTVPGLYTDLSSYYYCKLIFTDPTNGNYIGAYVTSPATGTVDIKYIHSIYYDDNTKSLYIEYLEYWNGIALNLTFTNPSNMTLYEYGDYTGTWYGTWHSKTTTLQEWVDLSAGFYFTPGQLSWNNKTTCQIGFPNETYSATITVNLDSITAANYQFRYDEFYLKKTTTDDVVSWSLWNVYPNTKITDLYYDQSRSDNTYQITKILEPLGEYNSFDDQYFDRIWSFNYVGGWPTAIAKANSYWNYTIEHEHMASPGYNGISTIAFLSNDGRTPTVRVDEAIYKAFEYPVIQTKEYDPAAFKTNPATTISKITMFGTSIEFGGNTYPVSNGKITLGSHQIAVDGLVFSSVPVPGGYDNKIGNTTISTTAAPSTITFNGKWSASVDTMSQESFTYTKTEWIAGSFAWDGVDQNFLMVGLITCLGVFIALGIYARRSGARVLPLMIVCGGAALLFFVML